MTSDRTLFQSVELWESTDFVKQINDFLLQHGFARARGTVGLASL